MAQITRNDIIDVTDLKKTGNLLSNKPDEYWTTTSLINKKCEYCGTKLTTDSKNRCINCGASRI